MNITETYNARNVGMKQEILDMKSDFVNSLDGLKSDICSKFSNINNQLVIVKHDLKLRMEDIVFESLLKVKDSIIEALSGDNAKLHERVENMRVEFPH